MKGIMLSLIKIKMHTNHYGGNIMKLTRIFLAVFAAALVFSLLSFPAYAGGKKPAPQKAKQLLNDDNAPEYSLLFFRNDGRILMIMPKKTTFMMVYRSEPNKKGYVKCINRKGETLAIDRNFEGDVEVTTPVSEPSLKEGRIVVTRYNGNAIGFYTPEDAAYIEIINSRNGFDGVVTIMNKKKKILCRESGLNIRITDYRTPEVMKKQPDELYD